MEVGASYANVVSVSVVHKIPVAVDPSVGLKMATWHRGFYWETIIHADIHAVSQIQFSMIFFSQMFETLFNAI